MRMRTRWAAMATGGCLFTVALGLVGFMFLSAPLRLWLAEFQMSGGQVLNRGAVFHFEGDSLTVPIHLAGGVPYVDVTVNGHGPYPFLLDTGAPETGMALHLCEDLALPRLGTREYTYDSRDLRIDEPTFAVD